jgi:hypothetical protein
MTDQDERVTDQDEREFHRQVERFAYAIPDDQTPVMTTAVLGNGRCRGHGIDAAANVARQDAVLLRQGRQGSCCG